MNVFPVPDGDTGTNLAATVQSVSEGTVACRSLSQTSASMADAALMGARGNSGLIFAQFLWGFSRGTEGLDEVDVKAFGKAVSGAVPYAREALSNPVEGTILTVMEDWASEVATLSRRCDDFAHILPGSLETARKSWARRRESTWQAGVLDAGGQGFVDFLGIVSFRKRRPQGCLLLSGHRPYGTHGISATVSGFQVLYGGTPPGRVWTSGVSGPTCGPSGIPSSWAVTGKVRVHIHTDTPTGSFTIKKHGSLTQQKPTT